MIRRLASLILILLLLLLALAACSGEGQVAARVNGVPIELSEVAELRSEPTVGRQEFLGMLFRVVAVEALSQAVEERFGVTVEEEAIRRNEEELRAQIESQDRSVEEFLASQGYSTAMLRRLAEERALRDVLVERLGEARRAPSEEELRRAYEDRLSEFVTVCARHILVETEEEAASVLEKLGAGEDFAALAGEVSLDQSAADSDLGCRPAAVYPPELIPFVLDAPIGRPAGPARSQLGWHVFEVRSRETVAFEQARGRLAEELGAEATQTDLEAFLNEVLREADVEVAPRYGRWVTDPVPTIEPPGESE